MNNKHAACDPLQWELLLRLLYLFDELFKISLHFSFLM